MNQLLDRDCSILVIFFLLESRKNELTWWPLWQLWAQSVFCLHHAGISSYPSSGCYWISAGQREKAGWKYEIILITFDNLIPVFRDFFTLLHRSVSKWGEFLNLTSPPTFTLQVCTSLSSSTTNGTCYTASECSSKGGSADGNCAAGFGVCCKYWWFYH